MPILPDESPSTLEAKLEHLRNLLRSMKSVLVCFSGGVDSAFLLAVAHQELKGRAFGLTALSPSLAGSEEEDARRTAQALGAQHILVRSNELSRPGYVENAPDRCFHCKSELYAIAETEKQKRELAVVLNGANLDDLSDYRPGLQAAKAAGVRSPLVEAGFHKADVRAAARLLGLQTWDKPAAACLSSRIPYGTRVTPERLAQIAGFEAALKALGFQQVRVRWHEHIARIEVEACELERLASSPIREQVVSAGKEHGFQYITLDLAGYRVGSHNEVIDRRALPLL